jgi:sugar O-acyltransferase (sialic acid O-acetyltransferase NeuD family)
MSAQRDIVIIGASGFGKEVAFLIEDINRAGGDYRLLGFLDDAESKWGSTCLDIPVLGALDWLRERADVCAVVGIGDPDVRSRIVARLDDMGIACPTLIHPSVVSHASNRFGDGAVVCAGNVLTVEICVGRHVHLNLCNTVGHGAVLGDFSTVYPGVNISGDVTLGERVSLGTGGQVLQGVTVGPGTFVGAGATVTRDLPGGVIAVGTPAKPIKERP